MLEGWRAKANDIDQNGSMCSVLFLAFLWQSLQNVAPPGLVTRLPNVSELFQESGLAFNVDAFDGLVSDSNGL